MTGWKSSDESDERTKAARGGFRLSDKVVKTKRKCIWKQKGRKQGHRSVRFVSPFSSETRRYASGLANFRWESTLLNVNFYMPPERNGIPGIRSKHSTGFKWKAKRRGEVWKRSPREKEKFSKMFRNSFAQSGLCETMPLFFSRIFSLSSASLLSFFTKNKNK